MIIGTSEARAAAKILDLQAGKVCVPKDIADLRHRLDIATKVASQERGKSGKLQRNIERLIRTMRTEYHTKLAEWARE